MAPPTAGFTPPPLAETALTKGIVGTPHYMAPEQYAEKADARSDVWGLGVTLYELLTLRRAFDGPTARDIEQRVTTEEPRPLERLVGNVPKDLAAICRKAIDKNPDRRYPSAQALADDLRRWLRLEPTLARPARTPRRLALWARRNPGLAAAITVAVFAGILLSGALIRTAHAETAHALAEAAAANEIAESQRREAIVQKLERHRLTARTAGWWDDAWEMVREAGKIRKDFDLRNLAAATLIGLDARQERRFEKHDASSLAWDATGRYLLMGGPVVLPSQPQGPALLWDSVTDKQTRSQQVGGGPVAFRRDGTPLQLVVSTKDRGTLILWDVAGQRLVREFKLPAAVKVLDLAPGGSLVAAAGKSPDDKDLLAVWDADSGQVLFQSAVAVTELAFSPSVEGKPKLLAGGTEDGQITIWSLPKGEQIASLDGGRHPIQALAFGRNVRRSAPGKRVRPELHGWLLAAGGAGGNVSVWDLQRQQAVSHFHGSSFDVYALAFSPDGTTLASAGRGESNLWDLVTGRHLLDLPGFNYTFALCFSPDGKKLAAASWPAFGGPGGVTIWEIENGRGVQTLRGLTGKIDMPRVSGDGRFLTALADNWEAAVWESQSGRLLHLLETPRGVFGDNAGLALNADFRGA